MRDPLARFLGPAEDGVIEYRYADAAVRLAGHSRLAVAGAYLMVLNGLNYLYDDEPSERGNIAGSRRDARDHP